MEMSTWDALKHKLVVSWANIDTSIKLNKQFQQMNKKYKLFVDSVSDTFVSIHKYEGEKEIEASTNKKAHLYYDTNRNVFVYNRIPYYYKDTKIKSDNFIGDKYFLEYLNLISDGTKVDKERASDILFSTSYIFSELNHFSDNPLMCLSLFANKNFVDKLKFILFYYANIVNKSINDVIDEIKILHTKKNTDYTVGSSDALSNFMLLSKFDIEISPKSEQKYILNGFLWRIGDKISRIRSFNKLGKLEVKDDPYQDAIRDFLTYIGLLYAFLKRVEEMSNIS